MLKPFSPTHACPSHTINQNMSIVVRLPSFVCVFFFSFRISKPFTMIPTWHSSLYFRVVSVQSRLGKWEYILLYERNFYQIDLDEIYVIFYIVSQRSNLLK